MISCWFGGNSINHICGKPTCFPTNQHLTLKLKKNLSDRNNRQLACLFLSFFPFPALNVFRSLFTFKDWVVHTYSDWGICFWDRKMRLWWAEFVECDYQTNPIGEFVAHGWLQFMKTHDEDGRVYAILINLCIFCRGQIYYKLVMLDRTFF